MDEFDVRNITKFTRKNKNIIIIQSYTNELIEGIVEETESKATKN